MGDASVCDPQVTDDPMCSADFGTAQLQCNEMEADLTSIHDKYENGKLPCFSNELSYMTTSLQPGTPMSSNGSPWSSSAPHPQKGSV